MTALYEKLVAAEKEYFRRLAMENMSPKTLRNYHNVVESFTEFVGATEQTDEFVAVVAWKTSLFEKGMAPTSIKQYLITLEIFFGAASHRSYPQEIRFGENPIDKTLMPKIPERPYPVILTDDQVKLLFNNTPPTPNYKQGWPMTWAVLMLLLNEKIRCAELTNLRLSDVDFHDHILTVRSGKGRKYREVDLTELTEVALTYYLDSGIRPAFLDDEDFLFGNTAAKVKGNVTQSHGTEKWHKFSESGITEKVERVVEAITGEKNVRAHDLRKIGSRVCLNAGQSMEMLQGQLGHAQISTTQIYTSRMGSRRSRESARSVLASRDAAAEELRKQKTAEQNVVPLYA